MVPIPVALALIASGSASLVLAMLLITGHRVQILSIGNFVRIELYPPAGPDIGGDE